MEYSLSRSVFIVPAEQDELLRQFANEYISLMKIEGKKTGYSDAIELMKDPCYFGIFSVRMGHADIVAGGITNEPVHFFRPMLKFLKKKDVQSETGIFILPDSGKDEMFFHNVIVFGDVGVNGTMTPETLANIAVDTCTIARNIIPEDVLPDIHGAIISYSNHGSDEGPSPELVKKASELVPDLLRKYIEEDSRYGSIRIEGEIKANVALSKRSAMYYAKENESWTGPANVIICPNLDMGNLLYHLYATRYPEATKFTIISGVGFAGIDFAKDCSVKDIELGVKASILNLVQKENWKKTAKDTFFRRYRILAVNPGSTSTKICLYDGDFQVNSTEIKHSAEDLSRFEGQPLIKQLDYRKETILNWLRETGIGIEDLNAVSARGGLLQPIPHGTYRINDKMLEDLRLAAGGEHASNLGALIADEIAGNSGIPAYIVDPVVVDEAEERVKITGIRTVRRKIISHALSQISSAKRYAEEHETFYENLNLIVCHLGGGISTGAHRKGRYVDVNNALDGEGPFSPQRSGSLPAGDLISMCFSGKYTEKEIRLLNKGRGGLIDLLGTNDLREVLKMIKNGDRTAADVFDALVYQVSKSITALLPAFNGEAPDGIILTGGMARSEELTSGIEKATALLGCDVTVYPGENEMDALARGAEAVLQGREESLEYRPG